MTDLSKMQAGDQGSIEALAVALGMDPCAKIELQKPDENYLQVMSISIRYQRKPIQSNNRFTLF